MNHLNDAQLATLLKADSIDAFNVLYKRYVDAIYANLLKLNRDVAVSKDILQEVFLALWDKRKSIDPEKSIAGWLFSCSYHKSINNFRKQLLVAKRALLHVDRDMSVGENDIENDRSVLQSKLLQEAVEQLSPQKRKVFELCKVQGKSYEKAAIQLSLSKHTVKEYLAGAIYMIKKYIGQHPQYFK